MKYVTEYPCVTRITPQSLTSQYLLLAVFLKKTHQWSKPHSRTCLTAFVVQHMSHFFFFEGNIRRWSVARETAKRMDKKYKRNRKSWQRQNSEEKSWWTINESQKYHKDLEKMFILFQINSKKELTTVIQIAQCPMWCQYYAIHYTCRCIISSSLD